MKKFLLNLCAILIALGISSHGLAQFNVQNLNVNQTKVVPTIDGVIDALWDQVPAQSIEIPNGLEFVSIRPDASYKAIWDNENIYLLVTVPDDDFYPHTEAGGNSWEADKVELYFDVNAVRQDGIGPESGQGHHQIAPAFNETPTNYSFAYSVDSDQENYICEYAIPLAILTDNTGEALNPYSRSTIGFDVSVIDLDETNLGANIEFGRINWCNDANVADSWFNLDYSGNFTFLFNPGDPDISALSTLNFGALLTGETIATQVTFSNQGSSDLVISDIQSNNSIFTVSTSSLTIIPGESANIMVYFSPNEVEAFNGIITIASNDPDEESFEITVTGTGLGHPEIDLITDPIEITLAAESTGSSSFTISNLGLGDLSWGVGSKASFTKANYADISLKENQLPLGSNVYITSDANAGLFNAFDESSYNWGTSPTHTEWALGYTNELNSGDYTNWRDAINGNPTSYLNTPISVHVIDDNTYFDLEFTQWTSGANGGGFTVEMNTPFWLTMSSESANISAESAQQIDLIFNTRRMNAGTYNYNLIISSNDSDESNLTIPIQLTVTGAPDINGPLVFDFGDVVETATQTTKIAIENTGNAVLNISEIISSNSAFSISSNTSFSIDPDNTEFIELSFNPTTVQAYIGNLTISSDDADESNIVIALSGNGIGQPEIDLSVASIEATVVSGSTTTADLVIDNTGVTSLSWEIDFNAFTKADYSNWELEDNQWRLSPTVWITRKNNRGIFNIYNESSFNSNSPSGTLWARGYTSGNNPGDYQRWTSAISWNPPGVVNDVLSIYLTDSEEYVDVKFTSWTSGGSGGGFTVQKVLPSWLTLTSESGTIAPAGSETPQFNFDASSLFAGVYEYDLTILSNDVDEAAVLIPVTLTVTGEPEISSATSYDFGNVTVFTNASSEFLIENTGTDTLKISNVSSSNIDLASNVSSFFVLPGENYYLELEFDPQYVQAYNSTITLTTNDSDEGTYVISVTGVSAYNKPIMSINSSELESSANCSGSTSLSYNIENSGDQNLDFTSKQINFGYDTEVSGKANIEKTGVYAYNGMVWVEDSLFYIQSNRLYKWDKNADIIETWVIRSSSMGITYDGEFLWIGNYNGNIYKCDLEGNELGDFIDLPFNYYPAIAFNGEHIIAVRRGLYRPTFYEYDLGGNLIASFSSSTTNGFYRTYGMVYVPEHGDGGLWATSNNGMLYQLNKTGSTYYAIRSFYPESSFDIDDLAHDGNNLWTMNGSYGLVSIHDGITEMSNWLTLSAENGTIAGGDNNNITATFNALSLNAGVYTGTLIIESNDLQNDSDTIEVSFTVSGVPEINVSRKSVSLADTEVGNTTSDTVMVYNTGCDTLFISNFIFSKEIFSTTNSSTEILPNDSLLVRIDFNPAEIADYTETLTITNNDADSIINLSANCIAAPALLLSDYELDAEVYQCGDSVTEQLIIYNAGAGNMHYKNSIVSYGFDESSAGEVLELRSNVYAYYGMDMEGDFVYYSQGSGFSRHNLETNQRWYYGTHNNARGLTYDGENVWMGNNLGQLIEYTTNGQVTGNKIELPYSNYSAVVWNGECFIVSPTGVNNPTFYKVSKTGEVLETYSSNLGTYIYDITWDETNGEGNLWAIGSNGNRMIMQLSEANGTFSIVNEIYIEGNYRSSIGYQNGNLFVSTNSNVFYTLDDGFLSAENWLSISDNEGTSGAYENKIVDVKFNSQQLNAGTYSAGIIVKANDPVNSTDTIVCSFIVNGNPQIVVSETDLNVGEAYRDGFTTDTLVVYNTGCDTLKISGIGLSNTSFSTNVSTLDVLPSDSAYVIVTFEPTIAGTITGILSLENNSTNTNINLTGIGIGKPDLEVNTDSINGEIKECFGLDYANYSIENSGDADLIYEQKILSGGFDTNIAGDVIDTKSNIYAYQSLTYGYDDYIFYTRGYAIQRYNITTGQNLYYYTAGSWGAIVYDGEYIWMSSNTGLVSKFSTNGVDQFESFQLPFNAYSAMAYDGENFIVARRGTTNPTIYKIDKKGNLLESYVSNIGTYINGFAWSDNLLGGNLWAIGSSSNRKVMHLNQVDGEYTITREFIQESGSYRNGLAFDGDDIWIVNTSNIMYQLNDGIINASDWMSLSSTSGTVPVSNNEQIDVEFNAGSLSSGNYQGAIVVSTNDPANKADTIYCELNVEQLPKFEIEANELDFGDVYLFETFMQTIEFKNSGCDVLNVNSIESNSLEYAIYTHPFELQPGESTDLRVFYSPSAIGASYGELAVLTNDKDTVINLSGNGIAARILSISTNKADGNYSEGESIELNVEFDRVVDVETLAGTPNIKLNTEPVAFAEYLSGSGSTNLVFEYIVGSDDETTLLDYTSEFDLALDGGTIQHNGEDAGKILPIVGDFSTNHKILIENVHPEAQLSSVDSVTNGSIQVQLVFNEEVSGFGLGDLNLTNANASGLNTVVPGYEYTFNVNPSGEGEFTIELPENSGTDLAGNGNLASNQLIRQYDVTNPTPSITSLQSVLTNQNPFMVTIDFDEEVKFFDITDLSLANCSIESFTEKDGGTSFEVAIIPNADGIVTVDINAGVARDLANNINNAATQFSIEYDGTGSIGTMTSAGLNANNRTAVATFNVNVLFDEEVTGFEESDIYVENATLSNFTEVLAGFQYTVDVTANEDGEIPVTLYEGIVTDNAGNYNQESELIAYFDTTAPSVVLTSVEGPRTNQNPFTVVATFDEPVSGFTIGDFIVTDGIASNFTVITAGTEYSIDIVPNAEDTVFVDINADVVLDDFGTGNKAATQLEVIHDLTAPLVSITANTSNPTNQSPFGVTVAFNEDIYGFNIGDIRVTNGTASNLVETVAGKQFTIDVTPYEEGVVTIIVPTNSGTDMAGNASASSGEYNIVYEVAKPIASLSSSESNYTNLAEFLVTIDFSEYVTGFELADLTLVNATAASLTTITTGIKYTVEITPSAQGNVSVGIGADAVTDQLGNTNDAATPLTVVFDNINPAIALTSPTGSSTNQDPIDISIVFSEEVSGFELSDIRIANGSASTLTEIVSGTEYTAEISPKSDGNIFIEILSNSTNDLAQNGNDASTLELMFDGTAPLVDLSTTVGSATNQEFDVKIKFTEEVTGFSAADLSITNGTANNLIELISGIEYSVNIAPLVDNPVEISVNAAAVNDLIGNANKASNIIIINYDATLPTVNLSSEVGSSTNESSFEVNVEFSEAVIGFSAANVIVSNGRVGNIIQVVENTEFKVSILPSVDGNVTIHIPENVVADEAGNSNSAAVQLNVLFDKTSPEFETVEIESIADQSVDFILSVSEDATVYYAVLTRNISSPTYQQLIDADIADAIEIDNMNVIAASEANLNITGLDKGERYTLYAVAQDELGNRSGVYDLNFSTTGVGVEDESLATMQAYPNPNNGVFTLEFSSVNLIGEEFSVLSLSGQLLSKIEITEIKQTVNLSEFEQGYYLLQIKTESRVENLRIVIE